jgi:hypothetical protein
MSATTIIVNDESPRRQYTATAGQTLFDFPIPFFEQGDLTVYLTPAGQTANDAADLLTITTNYTVSGENTQDGGLVTLTSGATAGDIITIDRVLDLKRLADYQNAGDLLAETLNREQDSEIMISQQLRDDIDRSVKRSSSSASTADLTLPEPEAAKLLQWNSTGTGLENANPDQAAASQIYDTVADLKTQSIVSGFSAETRGYTTAGDGGGATYLIVPSQAADGYGDHVLANGNVAVLQPGNQINIRQFGADPTGTVDAWPAIVAAHAAANISGLPVVGVGTFLVDATVKAIVQTNTDYRHAKFNIADSVSLDELIKIETTSKTVITPPATNFNKGATVVSDLAAYPQTLVAIESGDTFVLRNGTDVITKKDVVYHSEGGHISHPLYFDMSTITAVTVKPAEAFTLEFKAPEIEYNACSLTYFIRSDRNQVTVYGGKVTNNSSGIDPASITVYFGPTACMLNTLDGRSGDPMNDYNSGGDSAYDFSGSYILYPAVRNLVSPYCWGSVDGNVYRELLVENSVLSRAGCHSMLFGGLFRNLRLTEKSIQVTGAGLLKLENVKKTVSATDVGANGNLVSIRTDYSGEWDGDVVIEDFEIHYGAVNVPNTGGGDRNWATVVDCSLVGQTDFGHNPVSPNITLTRGKITMSSNPSTNPIYHLVDYTNYEQDQGFNLRTQPERVKITDVEIVIPTGSGVTNIAPIRIPKIDMNPTYIQGDTEIIVENLEYEFDVSTLPLGQFGKTLFIAASAGEIAAPAFNYNYTFINCNVDAVFRAPPGWSLDVIRSNLYNINNFYNSINGEGSWSVRDCNWWPGNITGTAPGVISGTTAKNAGGSVAHTLGDGANRAYGNSIDATGTLAGPRTKTEFVTGYYDATYYEPL